MRAIRGESQPITASFRPTYHVREYIEGREHLPDTRGGQYIEYPVWYELPSDPYERRLVEEYRLRILRNRANLQRLNEKCLQTLTSRRKDKSNAK